MKISTSWMLILAAIIFSIMCQTLAADDTSVTASTVLSLSPPKTITAKPGAETESRLSIKIVPGYHVNSNAPSDPFLIGLRLTWASGPLEAAEVIYPKAETAKLSFSQTPVSIFTGEFEIVTRLRASNQATPGPGTLNGKLRYQACNDRMCLPPKTIDVAVPVEIVK